MTRFCILSQDEHFSTQLKMMLAKYGASSFVFSGAQALPAASFYLVDTDTVEIPDLQNVPMLCFGWNKERPSGSFLWLDRPFRPARLAAMVGLGQAEDDQNAFPFPFAAHNSVLTDSGEVFLTDTEFRLYTCLYEAKGAPVSREDLHKTVWNGVGDIGIVNVYIHYLRNKLEQAGTRLLCAIRGKGYALIRKEGAHASFDLR